MLYSLSVFFFSAVSCRSTHKAHDSNTVLEADETSDSTEEKSKPRNVSQDGRKCHGVRATHPDWKARHPTRETKRGEGTKKERQREDRDYNNVQLLN